MNAGEWQLAALLATLALECGGMAVAARLLHRRLLAMVGLCALVNCAVHPLFWTSLPWVAAYFERWPVAGLWLAEGVVIGVEGAVYWRGLRLGAGQAWLLSLLLNLLSWGVGSWVLLWLV